MRRLVLSLTVCVLGAVEEQTCLACVSSSSLWKEDECKRFSLVSGNGAASSFEGRHGHASVVFPRNGELALWVIGGRGERYEKWNFQETERTTDVYYSSDGAEFAWTKQTSLTGDFQKGHTDIGFLMEDILVPGDVAPFWERYGHSVDVLRISDANSTETTVMVLCGGFTPRPDNDVWVSENGDQWYRVGYAPWGGRGYHSSVVFGGELLVMGGSPLRNDVWAGTLNKTSPKTFEMTWRQIGNATGAYEADVTSWSRRDGDDRWSPRAAMAVTVQHSPEEEEERLFLTGGFASWPCESQRCHPLYDGARTRNDLWTSRTGENWTLLVEAAPWGERGWHSFVTWSDLTDPTRDVADEGLARMWLAGGGYLGSQSNSIVRKVSAYSDLWWTRDGLSWTQVSRASGAGDHSCSSVNAYEYGSDQFRGKYGHVMIPFWRLSEDSRRVCDTDDESLCVYAQLRVPALFFIGGDVSASTDPTPPTSDVFASRALILCDIDGHQCPYPQITTDDKRRRADTSSLKTKAGTCPDPLSKCPLGKKTCEASEEISFYAVKNISTILDLDARPDHAYSALNVSGATTLHPKSLAALHKNAQGQSLLRGFIARLQGCLCDKSSGKRSGLYSGDYCQGYTSVDAALSHRRPLHALVFLTSLLLTTIFFF